MIFIHFHDNIHYEDKYKALKVKCAEQIHVVDGLILYEAIIPDTGTATIKVDAQVLDQYGNKMSGCNPVYSIVPNHPNVTINSGTGEVCIPSNTSATTGIVTIAANYRTLTQATVSLTFVNTAAYSYDLYFDLPDGYTIDAYEDSPRTFLHDWRTK